MDDAVAAVLDDVFPDRAVDEVGPAGPSWNENNRTVAVSFADGDRAYLKVALDGDPSRIARERAALEYVGANCEVAVPGVIGSDTEETTPYLVTAPLTGEWLGDGWAEWGPDERADTARLVGRALATLHRVEFETHGRITGGDADGFDLDANEWADQLLGTVRYVHELGTSDRFADHFETAIELIEAERGRLSGAPAVLVHGDVTHGNCYRRDDGIGLLDWEDAHAGDPGRELRRTQRQLLEPFGDDPDERVVEALHEGYRDRAGGLPEGYAERAPIYAVVSFLDVSGFFDTWAPDHDRPTDELAEWVEREMEQRLAAV